MSLTGAAIGVDKAFLALILHDQTTLDRISSGGSSGDERIIRSCDIAADAFRASAIKGGYLDTDIDALTSSTLHVRWREYIGFYAIDLLAFAIGVPADIRKRCDDAKKYFTWLATRNETIDGLERIANTGGVVSQAPAERAFDRNNTSQEYALRNPKI
jgi:hypothetical protein